MIKTNSWTLAAATGVIFMLGACGREDQAIPAAPEDSSAAQSENTSLPAPVNGWIEHPLKQGIIKLQTTEFRADTIEIPLPAKSGLEYKLEMKQGDALVYSIQYGALTEANLVISEFHGHTAKRADGIGDLMFYSKANGTTQHGQFIAPWDGVQGWYLKNDSADDITVTLKVAGFYELVEE
jgi:hypothetical protein